MTKKLEHFDVQHTLLAMSDKSKNIKNPYTGEKRKSWNKPTKSFPNKWKMKFAKSDEGSYSNQGKCVNEHEYGKGWYYNDYYDGELDLVTTGEISCGGESEAELYNNSVSNKLKLKLKQKN